MFSIFPFLRKKDERNPAYMQYYRSATAQEKNMQTLGWE